MATGNAQDRFRGSLTPTDCVVVILTVLAPALGGATGLWAQAIIVLGGALLIFWKPPTTALPPWLFWPCAALGLLSVVGLLPSAWFGAVPWRAALIGGLNLQLPGTLSPQPRLSLQSALILLSTLAWASFLATRPCAAQRSTLLSLYASGVTLLGVLGLVFYFAHYRPPFWPPLGGGFGFFPNRNQTGNVLALGGLIALALTFRSFARKRWAGFAWAASYVVLGVAVVVNYSRGGIVIFFIGSVVWLLLVMRQTRRINQSALGLAGVLLALTLFLLFGGKSLERFLPEADQTTYGAVAGRLQMQAEAIPLLREASWHGIGLRNFAVAFAPHRVVDVSEATAIHPESDWVWLAVEMGWLAPLLILVAVLGWLAAHWPRADEPDFLLRSAIVVCAVAFLLHGLLDVSGHRLGAVWPAIFLLSLLRCLERENPPRTPPERGTGKGDDRGQRHFRKAESGNAKSGHLQAESGNQKSEIRNQKSEDGGQGAAAARAEKLKAEMRKAESGVRASGNQKAESGNQKSVFNFQFFSLSAFQCLAFRPQRVFRCCAVVMLVASVYWLTSVFSLHTWPSSARLKHVVVLLERYQKLGYYDLAIQLSSATLKWAPLDRDLYFHRALARMRSEPDLEQALLDFQRARGLEPNNSEIPFLEGLAWLEREPRLALAAWNDSLSRSARYGHGGLPSRSSRKADLYRRMLAEAKEFPEIRSDLRAFALDDRELLMVFLATATPEEFNLELHRLLLEDPTLQTLSKEQQRVFFAQWARMGDRQLLEEKFRLNPGWIDVGWAALAEALAGRGEFEQACGLAQRFASAPALPPANRQRSLPELKRSLLITTNDFVSGYALFQALMENNKADDALSTLQKLTAQKGCPRYFHYLEAQLWSQRRAWPEAWKAWRRYLAR